MIEDKIISLPWLKRAFDLLITGCFLIMAAPLFLIIFVSAKIEGLLDPDSGSRFFYREIRISQGQPFYFYKIRIFKPAVLIRTLSQEGFVHTKPLEQNLANLTRVGRVVKKFYLDELPQLFCILKGEMSLVGPRPWNPVDYQAEIQRGVYRKKVIKAGLTGLVQIAKSKNGNHQPGLDLDEQYIDLVKTLSPFKLLLLDVWILCQSFKLILKGEGL